MLKKIRLLINKIGFKDTHRYSPKYFVRECILTFPIMILLLLQKSSRSLQLMLNEFIKIKLPEKTITNGAFTKARKKLKHTAFIELNQLSIVDTMYEDGEYKTYKGHRVLACDGSKVRLPYTQSVIDEFGTISYSGTKKGDIKIEGKNAYGLASTLYDVFNHIAIDAVLAPAKAYEVNLAVNHLKKTQEKDLIIFDRNYPSFRMLAEISQINRDCLIRCSKKSFSTARKMLKGKGADSQTVQLNVHHSKRKEIKSFGLPETLTLRFVRVLLDTGEYEVLVTTLLDEETYETADFKELYYYRWGVETFYGTLKTRLNLESFSGLTAEAIKQDFYATVFLTGMESLLTDDAEEVFASKEIKNPQKVNKAVSFHTIKHQAIEILFGDENDIDYLLENLTKTFLQNPTIVRENRNPPRKKTSARKLVDFHKRKKKVCF
jgi:hypothetical protein